MAITNQVPRNVSTAAPGATSFPYDFKVFSKSDLLLTIDGVTKTVDVDFEVDGIGEDAGGNIELFVPCVGGETVMRKRDMSFERLTDYQNLGDLRSATLNNDQDAPIGMIQQVAESDARSLKLPVDSTASGALPAITPFATLVGNATGTGLEWGSSEITGDMLLRGHLATTGAGKGATLVRFLQGLTGAIARWLSDKLAETVSVDDFGAVGDGVADDTAAVQAALNSSALRVHFTHGKTYRWSANGPTIPSNKTLVGHGAVILQPNAHTAATISSGTEYCGFRIACGSSNIVIEGFDFRGPYYGLTPVNAYRSIGINISGRYDQYFYNNANYPAAPPTAVSGTSQNITVRFCWFNGFGQSGIIADQVDQFYAFQNRIVNCNRDGIRMYGVKWFNVSDNYIRDMTPGFDEEGTAPNYNVYGISATRVYMSTAGDGSLTDYRPTAFGVIARNIVRDCPTWKALDTHGGTDIEFIDNIIHNAHIGIGIDKGGFSTGDGYAPPRRIKVRGNHIVADPANTAGNRCGIFAVAHEATDNNFGEDLEISGNYVSGYGRDTADGGVVVSNFRRGNIAGNTIIGGLRAGLNFQNTIEDFSVSGGVIADIGKTSGAFCAAINPQGTSQRISIDGVTFRKSDTADTMTALSLGGAPTAGYGVKLGNMCTYQGTVAKVLGPANLDPTSPHSHRVFASGNVTNGGAASLSGGKGVASVSRVGAGQVTVTLNEAVSSTSLMFPSVTAKGNVDRRVCVNVTSTTAFDVYTRDNTGTLVDTGFYFEVKGY